MELTGAPTEDFLSSVSPFAKGMTDTMKLTSFPKYNGSQTLEQTDEDTSRRWNSRFRSADPEALNLLYRLLHVDATKRITAVDALEHPYVSTFHDSSVERVAAAEVTVPIPCTDKKSTAVSSPKLHGMGHPPGRDLKCADMNSSCTGVPRTSVP